LYFLIKKKLKKLESISHPFILDQIKKIIESTDKDIVIEAALLHRIKIDKLCNLKIYIDSKVSSIVSRLKNRSIDEDKARKLIKIQRDVKIKKSDADIVVKNMRDYKKLLVITKKIGLQYGSERLYKKQRRRQITYK
jgi:dephospho-CoA kinase